MDFPYFKLYLIIYIYMITIITLTLISYNIYQTNNLNRIQLIQAAMLSTFPTDLRLWDNETSMTKSWIFMTTDADAEGVPVPKFRAWRYDDSNYNEFCQFGVKLLVLWARTKKLKLLEIAEDIIHRSLSTFSNLTYLPRIPWGENWYAFSVTLSQLLSMYIYLGVKEDMKYKCYNLLMRVVTGIDRSLNMERDGVNVAYLGIPRLCATYYYDKQIFYKESRNQENAFLKLMDLFYISYNKSPSTMDGVYEDGSCIEHSKVATYSYFVSLNGFYENVYHALGLPSNIREIAHKMLSKILHPDIPWLPIGLFGRHGWRFRNKQWWDVTGNREGISLMPFSGLAIFKTPDFMVFARIQRPNIATYETDRKAKGELALAWIQLRRIYLKGGNYERELTWEILKHEPGVIIPADEKFQPLVGGENKTTMTYSCKKKSIDSFIGRLMDSELLFWKNKYNFYDAYNGDCVVTEAVVITSHGLEAYYKIKNECDKDLRFIWQDNVNKLAINDVNIETDGNSVVIPSRKTKTFNWRMLVSDGINSNVGLEGENLTFECKGSKYTVKALKINEKFLVLRGDIPALIGTSSSVPNDYVEYAEVKYRRDPKTFMYDLKQ